MSICTILRKRGGSVNGELFQTMVRIVVIFPRSCGVVPVSWICIVSTATSDMCFQSFGAWIPIYYRKSVMNSCMVEVKLNVDFLHRCILGWLSGV